jgi:hypothetical protein
VIDAAGAIYVIGGSDGQVGSFVTYFQDVWVSTDGGARPDCVGGVGVGQCTGWVLRGYEGAPRKNSGVLQGVLQGVLGGTKGY